VLGVRSVDAVNKRVSLGFADVPLQSCAGTLPVGNDIITVSWRKAGDTLFYHVKVPRGFDVSVDVSRLSLKAMRE